MKYVVLVSVLVVGLVLAARTEAGPTPQQDVIRLDARVSQLEQRLYTIENSWRNLEQQTRIASGRGRGGVTQDSIILVGTELQNLQFVLWKTSVGSRNLTS